MIFHFCIPIDRALKELKKGNNVLNCSPSKTLQELLKAEQQGKKFYSGCDNMNEEGRCAGHSE